MRPSDNRADTIVVLGAALKPDGSAGPATRRRIEHAVALWRAGAAPCLILCGGNGEAEAMQAIARAAGVPDSAMLLDRASTSTFDNAGAAACLMADHGLTTAILVSDGYHLPRARLLFRLHGVAVVAASAASTGRLRHRLAMAARELLTVPANLVRFLAGRHRRARACRQPDGDAVSAPDKGGR